jgi:hypothetical protein
LFINLHGICCRLLSGCVSGVRTFEPALEHVGVSSYHKLLLTSAHPPVCRKATFTPERLPAVAGVRDPQMDLFHMPREVVFPELLITTSPSAHDQKIVMAMNLMNLTQVRRDIVAMNRLIAR